MRLRKHKNLGPRRLRKLFKMKKGSPFKFMLSGKTKQGAPSFIPVTTQSMVRNNLEAKGFRVKEGDS